MSYGQLWRLLQPRISLENDFLRVRILSVGENFKRQLKGICNHAWVLPSNKMIHDMSCEGVLLTL